MATFIQGLTDQTPIVQPFQPDYAFIQKALSTMQSRYDQGFASIKNAYNSVLNAPISNTTLKMRRDAYAKTAANQLKNLASIDLSIDKNVQQAEAVFAPFWEDTKMLRDMHLTKQYQREMNAGFAARDSKDEKEREQYSDIAMRYLQNGLEQLTNANPDDPSFDRIEARRWVPFKNLEKYLNEQANASGLKIEWNTANGPVLLKQSGGPAAVPSFKTWAHNMLGNNFSEQFRVMGTVESEEKFKYYKSLNPSMTDGQIKGLIAKEIMDETDKGYKARKDDLEKDINRIEKELESYPEYPNEIQEANIKALATELKSLRKQKDDLSNEYNQFSSDYDKTLQDIASSPESYYTTRNRNRVVDGWANARAAATNSRTIDLNPIWQAEMNLWAKKEELMLQKEKNEIDWYNAKKPKTITDANGKEVKVDENGNPISEGNYGHYVGPGTTDVTKVGDAHQRFIERQQERIQTAHSNIFNLKTMGGLLQRLGKGHSYDEIQKWMDHVQKEMTDPGASTDADVKALDKQIASELQEATGIRITGPYSARNAMIAYTKKYLDDKIKPGGAGLTKDDIEMLMSYVSSVRAMEEYNFLEENRKNLVNDYMKKNKDNFKSLLKTNADGTYDIKSADEIAKDFPKLELANAGNKKNLSSKEFAQLYIDGRATYAGNGELFIDGEKWNISKVNGVGGVLEPTRMFNNLFYDREDDLTHADNPNSIEAKYGKSGELAKARRDMNLKVVPNLPEFQNETGKMGNVYGFNLTSKDGDKAYTLLSEAANPANHEAIIVDGKVSKDSEINSALSKLLTGGESMVEKYVSKVYYLTSGQNGKPVIRLQLNPLKDEKIEIDGVNLSSLSGKTIDLELANNIKTPQLNSMRTGSGYYVYGALLRGKSITSDALFDTAGFKFSIVPDVNKGTAFVSIKSKKVNPKTGELEDQPEATSTISFSTVSPDELVNYVHQLFQQRMVENQQAISVYKANPQKTTVKKSDLLADLLR